VKNKSWARNPIDLFVLARLEKEGVHPSPETDRARLIRRVSLDLIGLPPSIEEVDTFVADKNPNAYEKLVDRLLPRVTMVSAGHGIGWIWRDMPTATATRAIR
jgi:hypothetical protein